MELPGSLPQHGKQLSSEQVIRDAEAVSNNRDTYGPPGFRGLLSSTYVVRCAIFSALGGLLFGYDQGVVSVGWIADRYSQKHSIAIAVVVFIVGSILQTAAVNYVMLTTARLIGGLGIGMLSMVAPLYISEISPPENRGALLVLEELSIVSGIVVAFWITYGTRYIEGDWSWRLPFLIQIVPALLLGVGILFLPFSPRWLIMKGRPNEALKALSRLRQLPTNDYRLVREHTEIQAEAIFHKEISLARHPPLQQGGWTKSIRLELASWTDCFRRGCWRRTHVGVGLMLFQQLSGINALIYYSPSLFETMGLGYDMQLIMSGVLNILQLVGVTSSLWTTDGLGRRTILLLGSVAMAISHIIIAVLVGKFGNSWSTHRSEGWTSVAFLFVYMIAFGASWGPVPWVMPAEIAPSSLRAKVVALSTSSNWGLNFIVGLITPPLVQKTGYGAYTFFAAFSLLSFVWTFFFVPETTGRTLKQMDHVFLDSSSEEENSRRWAIEADLIHQRVVLAPSST